MATAISTTEESPNPTHSKTIDRVVEKQLPINEEIPIRTRATRAATRRRGLGDAAPSCVSIGLSSLDESKRTSTADAATERSGPGVGRVDSILEFCRIVDGDGPEESTNVMASLSRTHSGLVSS